MHMSGVRSYNRANAKRQAAHTEQRDKRRDGDDRQNDDVCADGRHGGDDSPTQP
jgi:hypothetical protein